MTNIYVFDQAELMKGSKIIVLIQMLDATRLRSHGWSHTFAFKLNNVSS